MVQRPTRVLPLHAKRAAIDKDIPGLRHRRRGRTVVCAQMCSLTLHLCSIPQTTQSNASQVVITQVETNISGKFSCEGNFMFAVAEFNSTTPTRLCAGRIRWAVIAADGRSLPHPSFAYWALLSARKNHNAVKSSHAFSLFSQFLPMRRISIRCLCRATCKSSVSWNPPV